MITLKKRARSVTNFFDELDHDDEFPRKVYSTVLKNFQHVRRGTIGEVLDILRSVQHPVNEFNAVVTTLIRRIEKL
ncbi:MAG: hypothetical protein KAJ55_06705 [Anaerolineales bacterium]|nr:hypothetical protein [Anaerolineales bacterium]